MEFLRDFIAHWMNQESKERLQLHILDVVLCALILRLLLSWAVTYKRVGRLVLGVLGLGTLLYLVTEYNLPLAQLLSLAVVLPLLFLLILSVAPDIRRIYENISLKHLFFGRYAETAKVIPTLAETICQMARVRMGGLFVIPKQDDVEKHIEGGEEFDARINKSLILSLFNTKAPRHDGAMLLHGDRITRIGAVLPLASAEQISAEWGTRHLAAAGLTALCDADVIVVSEERGKVSHGREGKLSIIEPLTEQKVEEVLTKIIGPKSTTWLTLRTHLFSLSLWVFAIGVALVGSLNIERVSKRIFASPPSLTSTDALVTFQNIPENLFVDNLNATSCRVFLKIPSGGVLLGPATLNGIIVDLKNYPAGKVTINLSPRMLRNLPEEWEVERFEPSQLILTLAESRQFEADIQPEVVGIRPEFKLGKVTVDPTSVTIQVRDRTWRSGRKLSTQPIDLAMVNQPGIRGYDVEVEVPPSVKLMGKSRVRVEVELLGTEPVPSPAPAPPR